MRKVEVTEWQKFWERTYIWWDDFRWHDRVLFCRCSCGAEKRVLLNSLRRGKSKNCWCKKIKHWLCINKGKNKFYTCYTNMLQRCNNPKHKSYKDYGAKWIKVEWSDFLEFQRDMYPSYIEHAKKYWEQNTTIDRIDGTGNYCKENCRRATYLVQANNLSSNCKVEYRWKHYTTLSELCREYWIKPTTLNMRLRRYWCSLEEALEKPIKHKKHARLQLV